MSPRVPKSFDLGANTITVHIVTSEKMQEVAGDTPWGLFVPGENRIYLQKVRPGFNKEAQLHTFWHEFFHALYFGLGRRKMWSDEVLVDQCGNLTLQALKSAAYR